VDVLTTIYALAVLVFFVWSLIDIRREQRRMRKVLRDYRAKHARREPPPELVEATRRAMEKVPKNY
jgi:hypothetical protein